MTRNTPKPMQTAYFAFFVLAACCLPFVGFGQDKTKIDAEIPSPVGFKDYALGSDISKAKSDKRFFEFADVKKHDLKVFALGIDESETIAECEVSNVQLSYIGGKLNVIVVDVPTKSPTRYLSIAAALSRKYKGHLVNPNDPILGDKPKRSPQVIKETTWQFDDHKLGNMRIRLEEWNFSDGNTITVTYETRAGYDLLAKILSEQHEEKNRSAASDL